MELKADVFMGDKNKLSDARFIEGLKNNDHAALKALYKKFFAVVLKHVLNNNGTEDEAKDIYQETIIVLYENARKPGFQLTCQLQTYIFSIAKRLWLKQIGRNGHLVKLSREEGGEEEFDVSDEVSDYERREMDFDRMSISMENLGEPCKSLIADFYLNKMNMDEIAEKFGYTNADNAKNQKYKCLQRLKKIFFEI